MRGFRSLFLFGTMLGASGFAAEDYPHLLRKKQTPCGFYLARLSSEFNGRRITEDLKPDSLRAALKDFDPQNQKLVAVGAPPDWLSRKKLKREVKRLFDEAGYPQAKYTGIRRIGLYLESKIGVFANIPGQGMRRLAGLDPAEISSALNGKEVQAILDAGGSLVISGTPFVGPSRTKMAQSVRDVASESLPEVVFDKKFIKTRSKYRAWADAFVQNPKRALIDSWHGVRSLFPYSEDMVRPTEGEIRSMGQKVTMHTIFTLASFALRAETLQVMIPLTVVNSANSAGTGTYRSFIGNWMSRNSDSTVARNLKGLMLASFFSFDLYLARHAFDGDVLRSFTETAGWHNFLAASWVSILFQSMWRTPVSAVLHRWERWKSDSGGAEVSNHARNVAGGAEKFLTYVMTQFYILSLAMKTSFFKVAWQSGEGLEFLSSKTDINTELGQTLLMNFNVGHLAMATVGLGAMAMKKHFKLFDRIAPTVEWLDKFEGDRYRVITKWIKTEFTKAADAAGLRGASSGERKELPRSD